MKFFFIIFLFLFCFGSAFSQCDSSIKWMISKIDSVAKVNNIEIGEVNFDVVAKDDYKEWPNKGIFKFEGPFLMVNETYYRIDKLLYFKIKNKIIEFVFQH